MSSIPVTISRLDLRDGRPVRSSAVQDVVAAEEPLEIRVEGRSVAVVMRTPGHDRELAAGFLLTEGVIASHDDIFEISTCPSAAEGGGAVDVILTRPEACDFARLTRHVFTSSSCGVCGKTTLAAALQSFPPLGPPGPGASLLPASLLFQLPALQRAAQAVFAATGGLHASALFDYDGALRCLREDVGRHNALDKVLGAALLERSLPLSETVLLLSGRVSFELMQKALAGRIPVIAAVGAPSSLAVEFAAASGQTLIGFLRDGRANIYSGPDRISCDP